MVLTASLTARVSVSPASGRPLHTGTNPLILTDVAWGDVYLCGGQSNMEYPMADSFEPKFVCFFSHPMSRRSPNNISYPRANA